MISETRERQTRCAGDCGALLSRYNDDPDGLCAVCRRAENERGPEAVSRERLELLILRLILDHTIERPDQPLHVRRMLVESGVDVDSWLVEVVMRHLGSVGHTFCCRGVRGSRGGLPGWTAAEIDHVYSRAAARGPENASQREESM